MQKSFLPYARQSIDASDLEAVNEALMGAIITRGATVTAFENTIAQYCGAKYAVAFNSGTSALIGAAHAAQMTRNDRLITTPNSFAATTTAGMVHGAMPTFIDIDRNTGALRLDLLKTALKERSYSRGRNVIIPVHFAGIPIDMQKLDLTICAPDDIVIEDAAHALGSCYPDGQRVGCCAWSQMTVFSFHAVKTITTGEGGMVLTNDEDLYERLKNFRNNGIEREASGWTGDNRQWFEGYYEVKDMTCNYNFTDFQAALGLSQFSKIDQFITKRRSLVAAYRKAFGEMPYVKQLTSQYDAISAFHLFVVQIQFSAFKTTRSAVMAALKDKGIGTQVHYIPIYRHPFYHKNRDLDFVSNYPEMEEYYAQALTLPLYYDLSLAEVEYIVQTLKDILIEERQKKRYPVKKSKKK